MKTITIQSMRCGSVILMALILMAGTPASAQDGYPYDVNPSADANVWTDMKSTWDVIRLLHTGVVARCFMVGTNVVPLPVWVEDWTVQAGSNTTDTVTITTTNCLGPFEWAADGTNGTAYPYITDDLILALDTTIDALIPHFVAMPSTNGYGTLNDWFATLTNGMASWTGLPMESKAGLMARNGIGMVGDLETNEYGWIEGGNAQYTRHTVPGSPVVLARASADYVFHLSGFPEGFDGDYFWRRHPLYGNAFLLKSGVWPYEYENALFWHPESSRWGLTEAFWLGWGFLIYETLGSNSLPIAQSGQWFQSGGGPLLSAISTVTTNWIFSEGAYFGEFYWPMLVSIVPREGLYYGSALWMRGGQFPLLHYSGPSNTFPFPLSVSISGLAVNTNHFPGPLFSLNGISTSETVSVSSEWTACTSGWVAVSNMIVSGEAPLGASIELLYTNLVTSGPSMWRLLSKALDERFAVVRKLKWTARTPSWVDIEAGEASSFYTNTWDAAKQDAIDHYETVSGNGFHMAGRGSRTSVPKYRADIARCQGSLEVTNLWTGCEKSVDIYGVLSGPEGNTNGFYSADWPDSTPMIATLLYRFESGNDATLLTPPFGDASAPTLDDPYWPTAPSTNGSVARGVVVLSEWDRPQAIIQWDPEW